MLARLDQDEIDSGPRHTAAGAERMCAVTRNVKPVADMIRFVIAPDGAVVPDLKRKLPGRGLWITATRPAVAEAVKKRVFSRGFKRDVRAGPDLPDMVDRLLVQAALDGLAMAHKAGAVAIGFGQVEAALAKEPIVALLHAADGSADGIRKLAAAVRRNFGDDADQIVTIGLFTSAQLDLAFGRSNVVHAALLAGPASDGALGRCRSLERFRTVETDGRSGLARE